MSAKKQIRLYCKWCMLNSNIEITKCPSTDCSLWPFREGGTIPGESKQKAIKRKCENCLNTTIKTFSCKEKTCQLFEYRDGHRPKNDNIPKKVLSAEHIKKLHVGRAKLREIQSGPLVETPSFPTEKKRRLITRVKQST